MNTRGHACDAYLFAITLLHYLEWRSNTERMDKTLCVRVPEALLLPLDEIASRLSELAKGAPVSRSAALRAALERGIAALSQELDAPARSRKTS